MAPTDSTGNWLFVDDDDGAVVRIALTGAHVRIGRDHSNDIWLDHPACATHALVCYRRDDVDHIKVYEGAKVFLNDVIVTGMHRLYSGDSVRVADRKFLYGRDDTPPEHCLGVTLFAGDEAVRATILRQPRVVIGRHAGDITIDDPSVADDHAHLELYSDECAFVVPGDAARPVRVDGTLITSRVPLKDGAVLGLGRVQLRLMLLPATAAGLMKPLVSAGVAAATGHVKLRAGLHESGAAVRSEWTPPPQDAVPPTVIGALPSGRPAGQLPGWLDDLKQDRPAPAPRPLAGRRTPKRAMPRSAASVAGAPPRSDASPGGPSVRVAPEVFQGSRVHHDSQGIRAEDVRPQDVRAQDVRAAADGAPSVRWPASAPTQYEAGLHDQMTDVLQIGDVRQAVANHYRTRTATPPEARPRSSFAPSVHDQQTQHQAPQAAADERQHPSSQPRPASRPRPVGHAQQPMTHLPPSPYSAAPPEGGLYRPSRDAGRAGWVAPQAAKPQLTHVMDTIAPPVPASRPGADPGAADQQRRVAAARARRAARSADSADSADSANSADSAGPGFGFSHHNPARAQPRPKKQPNRGPVDDSPRKHRVREVDNSPRTYDDEEKR